MVTLDCCGKIACRDPYPLQISLLLITMEEMVGGVEWESATPDLIGLNPQP